MNEFQFQIVGDPTLELTAQGQTIPMTIDVGDTDISIGFPTSQAMIEADPYEGDYTVTPSQTAQILATKGKLMGNNVTVEPIPSNYGLITWNGSVLTVS